MADNQAQKTDTTNQAPGTTKPELGKSDVNKPETKPTDNKSSTGTTGAR